MNETCSTPMLKKEKKMSDVLAFECVCGHVEEEHTGDEGECEFADECGCDGFDPVEEEEEDDE